MNMLNDFFDRHTHNDLSELLEKERGALAKYSKRNTKGKRDQALWVREIEQQISRREAFVQRCVSETGHDRMWFKAFLKNSSTKELWFAKNLLKWAHADVIDACTRDKSVSEQLDVIEQANAVYKSILSVQDRIYEIVDGMAA